MSEFAGLAWAPRGKRVLVKPIEVKKESSTGIIMTKELNNISSKTDAAKVVAVGTESRLKVGMGVLLLPYAASEVVSVADLDNPNPEPLLMVSDDDILAVMSKEIDG